MIEQQSYAPHQRISKLFVPHQTRVGDCNQWKHLHWPASFIHPCRFARKCLTQQRFIPDSARKIRIIAMQIGPFPHQTNSLRWPRTVVTAAVDEQQPSFERILTAQLSEEPPLPPVL